MALEELETEVVKAAVDKRLRILNWGKQYPRDSPEQKAEDEALKAAAIAEDAAVDALLAARQTHP